MIGYNEKNPSGCRKVTLWPPLSMTLMFDIFGAREYPGVLLPARLLSV